MFDYDSLDQFTRAYIEAALWSSMDDDGAPLDDGRDESDIAQDTLEKMKQDCEKFQAENASLLVDENLVHTHSCGLTAQAGHDFWLTRCGHGAGFWDGDWEKDAGQKLTEACKAFGNVDLYIGDDGKIYA